MSISAIVGYQYLPIAILDSDSLRTFHSFSLKKEVKQPELIDYRQEVGTASPKRGML
jgi:hypothetical protein